MIGRLHPILSQQVQLEVSERPLAPRARVVPRACLLNRHVRQVYVVVAQVFGIRVVPVGREAREASAVHVDRERRVRRDQNVDAQVKLLAAHEQWILDVTLADTRTQCVRLRPCCQTTASGAAAGAAERTCTTYASACGLSDFHLWSFFHSLIWPSLLNRKMPFPCALPIGFMIQMAPTCDLNSSTKRPVDPQGAQRMSCGARSERAAATATRQGNASVRARE